MNKTFKKTLPVIGALILLCLAAAPAHASVIPPNTVSFTQSSLINVSQGNNLTVDLVGANFTAGPDGVAFSLAWDPSILSYVNTTVANPPWDTSFVSDDSKALGLVDFVFLNKSVGDAGANFAIASFTFNVLGNPGSATSLTLSNDPFDVGFVVPGAVPINVNYVNSQVQVVPVPAAAWLFGSGLFGLFGMKRMRKAGESI